MEPPPHPPPGPLWSFIPSVWPQFLTSRRWDRAGHLSNPPSAGMALGCSHTQAGLTLGYLGWATRGWAGTTACRLSSFWVNWCGCDDCWLAEIGVPSSPDGAAGRGVPTSLGTVLPSPFPLHPRGLWSRRCQGCCEDVQTFKCSSSHCPLPLSILGIGGLGSRQCSGAAPVPGSPAERAVRRPAHPPTATPIPRDLLSRRGKELRYQYTPVSRLCGGHGVLGRVYGMLCCGRGVL